MARRILLVEDDPDTTELLRGCLELLNCIVDTEINGARAVARLQEQAYSGIILDLAIPGLDGFEVLRKIREGGLTIPIIAISVGANEEQVIHAGAQAYLAKPFPHKEFKTMVQRIMPLTREELMRDHSGSENMLTRKAFALAKAGNSIGARKAIELLDDTSSQGIAYIHLVAHQVRTGDLAGAKETVHTVPALWTGGHWVRCLLGPLIRAGDLSGALEIVGKLTSASDRGFHKRVIVALQATTGDLLGARDTSEKFSPEDGHRDGALFIIAEALVRREDFSGAVETARSMGEIDNRAEALGTILAAQAKAQGVDAAEQTMAEIADESLKNQARAAMEEVKSYNCEPVDLLSVWRHTLFLDDTFDTLYLEN
jgi:two-component system, OmpR family, response regulator TctD